MQDRSVIPVYLQSDLLPFGLNIGIMRHTNQSSDTSTDLYTLIYSLHHIL